MNSTVSLLSNGIGLGEMHAEDYLPPINAYEEEKEFGYRNSLLDNQSGQSSSRQLNTELYI